MDVSSGFVLSDLRNDANPGVKARAVDGIPSQLLKSTVRREQWMKLSVDILGGRS